MNERKPAAAAEDALVEPLSAAGVQRRREMLGSLQSELIRVQRGRMSRRRAAAGAASVFLLAGAAAAVFLSLPRGPVARLGGGGRVSVVEGASTPDAPSVSIAIVGTDPSVLDRYGTDNTARIEGGPPPPVAVTILDDAALLRELAGIGRPAGLIRIEGAVFLTAAVTNRELEEPL